MKLILAILRTDCGEAAADALVAQGYRVTKVAATGGFLQQGNTTLLLGVEELQVEGALVVIKSACKEMDGRSGGIAFVLNASRYEV